MRLFFFSGRGGGGHKASATAVESALRSRGLCESSSQIITYDTGRFMEAMALGTPVVSTATMGTLDVLKEGEGCLIAEENHNDFATKVNQLLSDETHRAQLAQRGQTYAASWHEDTQSAALVALYRWLAAERLANTGKEVRK